MTRDSEELTTKVAAWFAERVPSAWRTGAVEVQADREEALVVLPLATGADVREFREATREQRIQLAKQAEEAFGIKISWGTSKDGRRRMFTTAQAPLTVGLGMPEREVLDGLVAAGVATDRAEAVAWCIRLVGHHEADWLRDLREAVAAAPAGTRTQRRERPVAI